MSEIYNELMKTIDELKAKEPKFKDKPLSAYKYIIKANRITVNAGTEDEEKILVPIGELISFVRMLDQQRLDYQLSEWLTEETPIVLLDKEKYTQGLVDKFPSFRNYSRYPFEPYDDWK